MSKRKPCITQNQRAEDPTYTQQLPNHQQAAWPSKHPIQTTRQTYSDKLRDPRWQKLRLQAFERDSFTCQSCGATDKPLNLHHLEYRKEPWDTPLEKLETLCEECHEVRETGQKAIIDALRAVKTKDWMGFGDLPSFDHAIRLLWRSFFLNGCDGWEFIKELTAHILFLTKCKTTCEIRAEEKLNREAVETFGGDQ